MKIDEKSLELREHLLKELHEKMQTRVVRRKKLEFKPRAERRGKVKKWTRTQIRKEFGAMAGEAASKLVIKGIIDSGERGTDTNEMYAKYGSTVPYATVTAAMSTAFKVLQPMNMVKREKLAGAKSFRYWWVGAGRDAEAAHKVFLENLRGAYKRKPRKAGPPLSVRAAQRMAKKEEAPVFHGPMFQKALETAIEKVLGVKVEVSGRIEVVFKLG